MGRNRAIARAIGDYVVLIDGDIVLDRHFVEDHLAAARTGFFVQGSRVIVGERKTREAISRGALTVSWFSAGIGNRKNCFRSRLLSGIFSRETTGLGGIKTCNFAFWREDALKVNGFNEDFIGWGREDSEFAVRLMNSGVRRRNLKFLAKGYHLHHQVCSRQRLLGNDEILKRVIAGKLTRCDNGIDKYL
jgi:GT2 family glycosyltransferase